MIQFHKYIIASIFQPIKSHIAPYTKPPNMSYAKMHMLPPFILGIRVEHKIGLTSYCCEETN